MLFVIGMISYDVVLFFGFMPNYSIKAEGLDEFLEVFGARKTPVTKDYLEAIVCNLQRITDQLHILNKTLLDETY